MEFETSPPFYPSPWVSGLGDWGASVAKAQALVAQMTLAEKVNLTTGVGYVIVETLQNGSMLMPLQVGGRALCRPDWYVDLGLLSRSGTLITW